jgi:hypothetical protein
MIEQLFGSKTRVKLLQLFYQNPNRSFYVREITRKIDEQINSVRRELANLLSIGIITSDNSNNKLYYEVSQDFEHYAALGSIFGGKALKSSKRISTKVQKAEISQALEDVVGIDSPVASDDPFMQELAKTGNVRLAIYTGQFTRDDSVAVDLLIVGDVNHAAVDHLVSNLEKTEKKEIRYSIFSAEDFHYRKQVNDRFVSDVIAAKKIVLVDKDKLL